MSVILILILASLVIALTFLAGFIWAVRSGQFEDTCTPGMRVLGEDGRSGESSSLNVMRAACCVKSKGARCSGFTHDASRITQQEEDDNEANSRSGCRAPGATDEDLPTHN